jgi:hypothetical protein
MSNYGFKITKKGKGIESTDPEDYIFWSKHPSMAVKLMDSVSIDTESSDWYVGAATTYSTTYTHDFGYIPQFMAFTSSYASQNISKFQYADYISFDAHVAYEDVGATLYEDLVAEIDDEEIKFTVSVYNNVAGSSIDLEYTYDIDFILFMEEAREVS